MYVFQYAIVSIFFLLEIAMLVSFMYWGLHLDTSLFVKILFGIGAPILVAVIWGTFIAPKASIPVSVPISILLQIILFSLAAVALYFSEKGTLAI
ncbi:MAG TPA: YrdB family protein, partial [Bacillus sp. (in: firmicutes)]